MRWRAALLLLASIAATGCERGNDAASVVVEVPDGQVAAISNDAPQPIQTKPASAAVKVQPAEASGVMDDISFEDSARVTCWADYCPCDQEDPDYGYLDVSICRDLKMGVSVADEVFSIGAKTRDARRAIREHKEVYGGDF